MGVQHPYPPCSLVDSCLVRTAQGPGLGVKGPPRQQPNRHLGSMPGMAPGIAQPEQEPSKRGRNPEVP